MSALFADVYELGKALKDSVGRISTTPSGISTYLTNIVGWLFISLRNPDLRNNPIYSVKYYKLILIVAIIYLLSIIIANIDTNP